MHKTSIVACKSSNSTVADDRFKKWEYQILTFGLAFCDNQECNFAGMNVSDLEDHIRSCNGVPNFSLFCCIHCRCGFSNKEDQLKHQENCNRFDKSVQKRGDSLHFRVIKRMKNVESGEDHIIQPMPNFPKGQYRRRRPYSIQHIKSWALSLEKYKYVKCIYQNCYFIAMSLEDMISHFGYCNGDGDFAKFICQYCNGRVTSEAVLQKHISRSHPFESNRTGYVNYADNSHIKVEPQSEENNDSLLFKDMELESAIEANIKSSENFEESQKSFDEHQELNEDTKIKQSACWRVWKCEINEFGFAFCRKSLCNFMAPNIPLLEVHLRTCDGTPDFEFLNCPKCRYRLPTREDLVCHISKCDPQKMKYNPPPGSKIASFRNDPLERRNDFPVCPFFRHKEGKGLKFYSKHRKVDSVLTPKPHPEEVISKNIRPENNTNEAAGSSEKQLSKDAAPQRKRGRPRSTAGEKVEKVSRNKQVVKCGKCDNFQGTELGYNEHNLKIHIGLGWIEGETPVDMNDEKLIVRLVKEAFKFSKKAECEKCSVVKRSVMGFISHIQNCGKTEEEKEAMKVACPYCDGKYLKYSVNAHIKFCGSTPEKDGVKKGTVEEISEPSGKRQSAIRAASKFQQVLSNNDSDEENSSRSSGYLLYEKGDKKLPKLNLKLKKLWQKLTNENENIPCRFDSCKNVSHNIKEATAHYFNCSLLPSKVFFCESCDFYNVDESALQTHVNTHRKNTKHRKMDEDDEEVKIEYEIDDGDEDEDYDKNGDEDDDEEESEDNTSDGELEESDPKSKGLKRKRSLNREGKAKKAKLSDTDIENKLRQNFCKREKLENLPKVSFYSNGLDMTLEEELSSAGKSELWPELHTSEEDWVQVPLQRALSSFPELNESVSMRFCVSDTKWRRFKRFESDLVKGVPVFFTGGSIRSMSWCKVSFRRMIEKTQRQFLAVATARNAEHFRDIYNKSSFRSPTLLQIWDIGVLDNAIAQDTPKLSLGLVHSGGEIWDLAWFPEDTYSEGTEHKLKRLGLLATASEDGLVRIWSICDPEKLKRTNGLPIYKTEPKVVLVGDKDVEGGCLQLAVGPDGVLMGGFGNGSVSVWNLKNLSSPFCKNSEKFKTIRAHIVIQAHKAAITALTFCPLNNRYFSTAGLDRFVKVWDTESPSNPVEQYNKECSLDNIWTKNWPSLIFNFDDVALNCNKGTLKFIRNIVTDRHRATFIMENECLSLSFSDWLNTLCAGSITGEIKLVMLKNLMYDQIRPQKNLSSLYLEKLNGCSKKDSEGLTGKKANQTDAKTDRQNSKILPRTYDEVNAGLGLVFQDNPGTINRKTTKSEVQPEMFPIRAVNKVAFNPNFQCFTHVAFGYNCGLIRIHPLEEFQSQKSLKLFIEKAQGKKF